MIELTRLDGTHFLLNSALIRSAERTPDTTITLMDREKLLVQESPREVFERILAYRRASTVGQSAYGSLRWNELARAVGPIAERKNRRPRSRMAQ